MAKAKVKREVELDAQTEADTITQKSVSDFDKNVFKENLKKHDAQINRLRKELKDNLDSLYKDMHHMRDRINKAMERLGLEGI